MELNKNAQFTKEQLIERIPGSSAVWETQNRRRGYFCGDLCRGSAMMNQMQMWPEGETFTQEVMIRTGFETSTGEGMEPAGYEDFPVRVTFKVPPFDVVAEMWRNTDPDKSYSLFRQFIVAWDQEGGLTDKVLMGYLYAYPGTDEAFFRCWVEYMKGRLASSAKQFSMLSQSIN